MAEPLLVRGRWVVTGAQEDGILDDAAVLVDGERIADVGPWRALRRDHPEIAVLGGERHAVLPGLVNAHHHSSGVSALQQGIADDLLEPWILAHARLRPSDVYLDTLLAAARQLATGVTSLVDVRSGGGSAEAFEALVRGGIRGHEEAGTRVAYAAGIYDQSFLVAGKGEDERFLASLPPGDRALAGQLLLGPDRLDRDDYLAIMGQIHADLRDHPRIDLWFAPPGPQWVSDPFMLAIAERAEALDAGVQTHVNESFYEKLHGERFYGMPTLLHLRDLGVLSPRFSIAHGVWLTEGEITVMAETGAAVSHNPGSNLRLRAGIAPLNQLLEAGVTVALGMDGTTLGEDEDLFAEMRLALRLNRTPFLGGPAPTPRQVFAMATAGGARLLRAESRVGRIAPGLAADLVLVDLVRPTWPWIAPEADPLEIILLRARAGDVDGVLVGGELVFAEGRPTRFDLEAAARELAGQLAASPYPEAQAELVRRLTPRIEDWYRAWELPELSPYTRYNSKR